jgi:hypothetical protein
MTGSNLPAMNMHHKRDAPWSQDHPEPDGFCPYCETGLTSGNANRNEHHPDNTTVVKEHRCPACGLVMHASRFDITEDYLEAWRQVPGEMEHTVNSYSELRAYS